MRHLQIPLLALIAVLLVGCETFGKKDPVPAPVPQAPFIAAIPSDVDGCAQAPAAIPDRALTAEETERLWKTDRARLRKLNGCFVRLKCGYAAVRKEVGKVETQRTCPART